MASAVVPTVRADTLGCPTAVDTDWSPVALETSEAPRTVVAFAWWPRPPLATVRSPCRRSVAEPWWSSAVAAPRSSDTAPCWACSGTEDNEWTRSQGAVCMAEGVVAVIRDIPAGCWRPSFEVGTCVSSVSPRLSDLQSKKVSICRKDLFSCYSNIYIYKKDGFTLFSSACKC